MVICEIGMCALRESVDSGIRSSGAVNADGLAANTLKCALDMILNRIAMGFQQRRCPHSSRELFAPLALWTVRLRGLSPVDGQAVVVHQRWPFRCAPGQDRGPKLDSSRA